MKNDKQVAKKKRGRPRSKVSTRDYVADVIIKWFRDSTNIYWFHDSQTFSDKVIKNIKFMMTWDIESESLDSNNIVEYYQNELNQYESLIDNKTTHSAAQWFFLSGVYYALYEVASKNIVEYTLNSNNVDFTNASALLRFTMDNPRYKQPSDLIRKLRKPQYPRRMINGLRRIIKELSVKATLKNISKEIDKSDNEVLQMIKVSNQMKLPIITGQNKERETIYIAN